MYKRERYRLSYGGDWVSIKELYDRRVWDYDPDRCTAIVLMFDRFVRCHVRPIGDVTDPTDFLWHERDEDLYGTPHYTNGKSVIVDRDAFIAGKEVTPKEPHSLVIDFKGLPSKKISHLDEGMRIMFDTAYWNGGAGGE